MPNVTMGWLERSGNDLQQGRLATAIWSDDADDFALLKFERDVLEGPELFVAAKTAAGERIFQAIAGPRIRPVLLRDLMDSKGCSHVGNVSARALRAKGALQSPSRLERKPSRLLFTVRAARSLRA